MKKIFITAAIILAMGSAVSAQRYCVIDTKYILESIPEYKDSQKKLDAVADQWQKEIDAVRVLSCKADEKAYVCDIQGLMGPEVVRLIKAEDGWIMIQQKQ